MIRNILYKMIVKLCFITVVGLSALISMVMSQQIHNCPGRILPGCSDYDLAHLKPTTQTLNTFAAHLAVDGNLTTCSETTHVDNPEWTVDLGKDVKINNIYLRIDQKTLNDMRAYRVEVQMHNNGTWQLCSSWVGTRVFSPLTVSCGTQMIGRHVKFSIPQNNIDLVLCDVAIRGECLNGSYGNYCENDCGNCQWVRPYEDVCDRLTGRCTRNCDDGWSGSTCKEPCPFKTYGPQCSFTCGECRHNQTCNRYTGECFHDECELGYKAPFCKLECDDGTYGFGCVECGNCYNNAACDKTSGACPVRCADGYKNTDPLCNTPCDDFTFGQYCAGFCGSCLVENSFVPGPCNKTTGECELGCAPGFYQTSNYDCRNMCPLGTWGINCVNPCGNCGRLVNTTMQPVDCSTVDGSCLTGCMPGWQGTTCAEPCTPGTYGRNCHQDCGKCRQNAPCDILTGVCPGDCENGYLGNMCTEKCVPGRFGYKCQEVCPQNCNKTDSCDIAVGSCICKDGWTGPKCADPCPANHYGKNCLFVCGNCAPGTTCNQQDGYCPLGCQAEWVGLKCDAKKIIEVYRKSYADVIGGSIAGVIAAALIIAFVVWVVIRYRKDKSIHIRELASSLRRMSLRGSQRIRKSIQRLSFRSRKNPDQQKMGKGVRNPDMPTSNLHIHKGKSSVPRMYECVQLQSNMIHYDDFQRLYLQLQETRSGGKTLLYDSYQSFLMQRPTDHTPKENGTENGSAYFNSASVDDVQVHVGQNGSKIPAFLPLGSNLSGFLLVNMPVKSEPLWSHLRQRQIENIITMGKDASYGWTPGERIQMGNDVVDCVDVQLYASHRETKLTIQRYGEQGRRAVRHLECLFWNRMERFPTIPTLLMFMERFAQIHARQRERSILVNYMGFHDQAILFTLIASCLEIIREGKRVDILRTVAIGGNATAKSVRSFEEFKFLHDVVFQYISSSDGSTSI